MPRLGVPVPAEPLAKETALPSAPSSARSVVDDAVPTRRLRPAVVAAAASALVDAMVVGLQHSGELTTRAAKELALNSLLGFAALLSEYANRPDPAAAQAQTLLAAAKTASDQAPRGKRRRKPDRRPPPPPFEVGKRLREACAAATAAAAEGDGPTFGRGLRGRLAAELTELASIVGPDAARDAGIAAAGAFPAIWAAHLASQDDACARAGAANETPASLLGLPGDILKSVVDHLDGPSAARFAAVAKGAHDAIYGRPALDIRPCNWFPFSAAPLIQADGYVREPESGCFDVVVRLGDDLLEALNSCPGDGTVLLRPGEHKLDCFVFLRGVSIFGRGLASIATHALSTFAAVVFDGVTLAPVARVKRTNCLITALAPLRLQNCVVGAQKRVKGAKHNIGIRIEPMASLVCLGTTFSHLKIGAEAGTETPAAIAAAQSARFEGCLFTKCHQAGVGLRGVAPGYWENNAFAENQYEDVPPVVELVAMEEDLGDIEDWVDIQDWGNIQDLEAVMVLPPPVGMQPLPPVNNDAIEVIELE